jgi:two-component system alkaline phosphatase synthesis response regulator PhoP
MARVLVIEDNPEMRMMMVALLQANGHEAVESIDGVDALRWAVEEQPDLVMLDVMMPRVDGWEALRQLKEDHRTADIPVIMVTARKAQEDMDRAEELGASDYVAKPWAPGELETRLRWALRKRSVPEFSDGFGLPAGFFECGCPMRDGEAPEDHKAPDDCFGNQRIEVAEAM